MKPYFERLSRYNTWMNDKLFAVCDTIPDSIRKQDLGAFFKSIHGNLNHLLLTDRLWVGRFTGRPFPAKSLDQELYSDFGELWAERKQTDLEIHNWVSALDDQRLQQEFRFTTLSTSSEYAGPLWHVVQHMFNHQTHHRGQITTLLNQTGFDSGVTDLMLLPPP